MSGMATIRTTDCRSVLRFLRGRGPSRFPLGKKVEPFNIFGSEAYHQRIRAEAEKGETARETNRR